MKRWLVFLCIAQFSFLVLPAFAAMQDEDPCEQERSDVEAAASDLDACVIRMHRICEDRPYSTACKAAAAKCVAKENFRKMLYCFSLLCRIEDNNPGLQSLFDLACGGKEDEEDTAGLRLSDNL